jgi:hypothetical protein
MLLLVLQEAKSFRCIPSAVSITNRPNSVSSHNRLQHSTAKTNLNLLPSRFEAMPLYNFDFVPSVSLQHRILFCTTYSFVANMIYLHRRSCIRNMSKRRLLQIRISREDGVSIPLYITNLLAWQFFVTFIFPFLEPIARLLGHVSFYYFYPNASGLGIVFEPLSVQDQSMNKRVKYQTRLDWHRFSVNVGGIGRDGYRHPPSVERNLPHLDVPRLGWKHWPWRRKYRRSV